MLEANEVTMMRPSRREKGVPRRYRVLDRNVGLEPVSNVDEGRLGAHDLVRKEDRLLCWYVVEVEHGQFAGSKKIGSRDFQGRRSDDSVVIGHAASHGLPPSAQ